MEKYKDLDLHPESIAYLEYSLQNVNPGLSSIEEKRKFNNNRFAYTTHTERIFKLNRSEIFIPSDNVQGGIPVYVYTPEVLPDNPTLLVFFHGGGYVFGNRTMADPVCKILAEDGECIVLNVEYRLAPDHKLPAPMDDGITVVNWLHENKAHLGGTPKSKVGLAGESVGARIVASIAHDVPADFQVLVYPYVHKARPELKGSVEKYKDGPVLAYNYVNWSVDQYLPPGEECNPRIAAAYRPEFHSLPPALFIIAEHDPWYDSCTAYAESLRSAGVHVQQETYAGAIHGFFVYIRLFPELCSRAHNAVVEFIKRMKEKN